MECKNHPETQAADRCAGCAEAFCGNCLVEVGGQKYCNSCKVVILEGKTYITAEMTRTCPMANEALICAVLGVIPCVGLILSFFALNKAGKAKKAMEEDPRLTGSGKANAAIVTALIFLGITFLGAVLSAYKRSR